MRLLLAVLTLAATVSVAVATAFASDKVDPYYYTDRVMTSNSGSSVSLVAAARSAGEIYQDLRQDNFGQ